MHMRVCTCITYTALQAVLDAGISSIAVVLKHAAIYPQHEKLVGQLALEMGFKQVMGLCLRWVCVLWGCLKQSCTL